MCMRCEACVCWGGGALSVHFAVQKHSCSLGSACVVRTDSVLLRRLTHYRSMRTETRALARECSVRSLHSL